jgi:predicted small lipoprotein YifL
LSRGQEGCYSPAFCYGAGNSEALHLECKVNRSVCLSLATIGMLSAALMLAGCGRKGALDPPPGGYVLSSGSGRTPVSNRGLQPDQRPQYDSEGKPLAPAGPEKRIPPDWLID